MMNIEKEDYAAMVKYCDELTKNGDTLSVTWSGGGDSGWFEMKKNDLKIEESDLADVQNTIIEIIEEDLGYGNFAGNFDTSGEVYYDRDKKCFEGMDYYSDDASIAEYDCDKEICVPAALFFDSLVIEAEAYNDERCSTSIMFNVLNGPVLREYDKYEEGIRQDFEEWFNNEIEDIDNFAGTSCLFTLNFNDFEEVDNQRIARIKSFSYNYRSEEDRQILVYLNKQNEKQ